MDGISNIIQLKQARSVCVSVDICSIILNFGEDEGNKGRGGEWMRGEGWIRGEGKVGQDGTRCKGLHSNGNLISNETEAVNGSGQLPW